MSADIKDVVGFEGRYSVTSCGEVFSHLTKKWMKTPVGKRGYPNLNLMDKNGQPHLKTVHRLVAEAFIPNPNGLPEVNHKDGDKRNNNVRNLEWVTQRENNLHARRTGLHKSDGDKKVVQIQDGVIIARYKSISEAERQTGINRATIGNVCRGYSYKGRHNRTAGGFVWKYEL